MKDSKAHVLTKTYVKMPFQLWPKIYYIFPPAPQEYYLSRRVFLKGTVSQSLARYDEILSELYYPKKDRN
jgi:hypothetical protein